MLHRGFHLNSTVNMTVRPSGLSARIVPRCPSAMLRAMDSPMPKPPVSALHFDHSIICVFEMQSQKIPCLQPEEAFCFIAAAATLRGANRGRHRRTGRFMGQLLCYSEIKEQEP